MARIKVAQIAAIIFRRFERDLKSAPADCTSRGEKHS